MSKWKVLALASLLALVSAGVAQAQVTNVAFTTQTVPFRFFRAGVTVSGVLDSTNVSTFNQTSVATDTTEWVPLFDQYYKVGGHWWSGDVLGNVADSIFAYQIVLASSNGAAVAGGDSLDITIQTSLDGFTAVAVDTIGVGAVLRPTLVTNPESATQLYTTHGIGTDRINWYNANYVRFLLRMDPNTVGKQFYLYLRRYIVRAGSPN